MQRFFKLILTIGILAFSPEAFGKSSIPLVCTEKMDSTPDLTQTDPEADFPHGGVHFCGPTAVSNSIVWLAEQGYDRLIPSRNGRRETQASLAMLLGSERYMNTTLEYGTSPTDILRGVSSYVRDCGYRYKRLHYQGWRKHPREYTTRVVVPELDWIKEGLLGKSAVWLNAGWYRYDPANSRYTRIGGHWVTLVGFGLDRQGREDPHILVIHDPSPRTRETCSQEYVRIERIDSGGTINSSGLSVNAEGFYKLTEGMRMKRSADYAIMDGAIVLEMLH